MLPAHQTACFLTQVYFEDLDGEREHGLRDHEVERLLVPDCELGERHGRPLQRHVHPVPRQRNSDRAPVASASSSGRASDAVQHGAYDKPIVFFEGLDVTNDGDAVKFQRDYGRMLRGGATQGVDVWHVSFADGGQPLVESARQAADAIHVAYTYNGWNNANPGKKIAAVGASMGALAGRIALASWEEGRYRCAPGTGECIATDLGASSIGPPIAVYGSFNGPGLFGASVPVTLQTLVQDIGNRWNAGQATQMLNSAAATNMLYARIGDRCGDPDGLVTTTCANYSSLNGESSPRQLERMRAVPEHRLRGLVGPALCGRHLPADGTVP